MRFSHVLNSDIDHHNRATALLEIVAYNNKGMASRMIQPVESPDGFLVIYHAPIESKGRDNHKQNAVAAHCLGIDIHMSKVPFADY